MTLTLHGKFHPFAPATPGRANAALFRCPCGGAMLDVTSRLAEAMGVLHHECASCRAKTVARKPGRR
jgi:hypothetical protein